MRGSARYWPLTIVPVAALVLLMWAMSPDRPSDDTVHEVSALKRSPLPRPLTSTQTTGSLRSSDDHQETLRQGLLGVVSGFGKESQRLSSICREHIWNEPQSFEVRYGYDSSGSFYSACNTQNSACLCASQHLQNQLGHTTGSAQEQTQRFAWPQWSLSDEFRLHALTLLEPYQLN